jgi:hypothetical protein
MTSTKARVYRVYLRSWDIFAHDVPATSNEQAIELARAEFDKRGSGGSSTRPPASTISTQRSLAIGGRHDPLRPTCRLVQVASRAFT